MKITILCVGKIKERFYRDAVDEYVKRLSRYAAVKIVEVADEKTPDEASQKEEALILEREGERLLKAIPEDGYVTALAIDGKKYDSVKLSRHLSDLMVSGSSHLVYVIGGSLGLSPRALARADEKLSFSDLTFPHQLMRVILLEQIYRSYRIMKGEPYHK